MCRSEKDPDGPRTCSGHCRSAHAKGASQDKALAAKAAELESALAPSEGTMALPANPNIRIPVPQTSDDPAEYVDPYPDMKGSDRVRTICSGCAGSGLYKAPTGIYTASPYVKNMSVPGHFRCEGRGFNTILVSSARSSARAKVKAHLKRIEEKEQRAAEAKKREAEAAKKEADRRASLVQGFVGKEGDKVGGLKGTIIAERVYTSQYGYHKTEKRFLSIKLDNGQVVTTNGSGQSLFGPKRGEQVTILSGTVSGQSTYQGQDQTALTRVKLLK